MEMRFGQLYFGLFFVLVIGSNGLADSPSSQKHNLSYKMLFSDQSFCRSARKSLRLTNAGQLKVKDGVVQFGKGQRGPSFTIQRDQLESGTIAFWISPVDWSGGDKNAVIFLDLKSKNGNGYLLYKYSQPGILQVYDKKSGTNYIRIKNALMDLKKGAWHHIALSWSKSDVKLYLDGKLVGISNHSVQTQFAPSQFVFGRVDGKAEFGGKKQTRIREICFLPRAISSDELCLLQVPKWHKSSKKTKRPSAEILPVGYTDTSPVVDGNIAPGEYTTGITQFVDINTHTAYERNIDSQFALTSKGLYIGLRIDLPDKYKPVAKAGTNRASAGDMININIRPDTNDKALAFECYYLKISPDGSVDDAWESVDWRKKSCERDWNYHQSVKTASRFKNGQWCEIGRASCRERV